MFSDLQTLDARGTSPRNMWSRLLKVQQLIEAGALVEAERRLEGLKYHKDLSPTIFAAYRAALDRAQKGQGRRLRPVNTVADFWQQDWPVLHPPFRHIDAERNFPDYFPFGLALPEFTGLRNDHRFLLDAATQMAQQPARIRRIHVVWLPLYCRDARTVMRGLQQQSFQGEVKITVLAGESPPAGVQGEGIETLFCGLQEATARIEALADEADLVLFLSGDVVLDDTALARAAFVAEASDLLVQPLCAPEEAEVGQTLFARSDMSREFGSRYPSRNIRGMNFAISAPLLRRVGAPHPGFSSSFWAAWDMLFRAFNLGCYMVPLGVPQLERYQETEIPAEDQALYIQRCPEHWARKEDGLYQVPKVSVYIPVYNASKYIDRAIESVLTQDVADLELCLHDDGSSDDTLLLLQARYGSEPRVRWQSGRNGGIGFASNQAIRMSRGMYIGQLDSDDCLKPGAVRRMMETLDEHPHLACCYGSCERVDAEGYYLKDEYSWPVFSREKMMVTSIAHHFRMFRRAAWERTSAFREDIVNAVDYDIFLKLSEVGAFHHWDEKLYQRRWHGENTSNVNEASQTKNTHHVQREALARQGLGRFWDVHVPHPIHPRKVTYRRHKDRPLVLFWPHYRSNPYQRLLYAKAGQESEICAGRIEAALRVQQETEHAENLTFHLHWLNFLFEGVTSRDEARSRVEDFLAKVTAFKTAGGRFVWTIHNTLSHDMPYMDLERGLSQKLAELADVLHLHSAASAAEIEVDFSVPREKLRCLPHGSYIGAYPDFVSRDAARRSLNIEAQDEVILFTGQVRPYKGIKGLVGAFRALLKERPKALLVVAGVSTFDVTAEITPALSVQEQSRIRFVDRFLEDGELQLFFRAADMAVYPYRKILTSGSMMLALSFGVPVVVPDVGMTREVMSGQEAGVLYDSADAGALEKALRDLLRRKDRGELPRMAQKARAVAEAQVWQDAQVLWASGQG